MYAYIIAAASFTLGVIVGIQFAYRRFQRELTHMRNTNALLIKRINRTLTHKEESKPPERTTRNAHNTNGH
jgi:hypothetical protein